MNLTKHLKNIFNFLTGKPGRWFEYEPINESTYEKELK